MSSPQLFVLCASSPISREIHEILFVYARHLVGENKNKVNFVFDFCVGSVSTEGRSACIGGVSGMVFDSVVEIDSMTRRVRFIVRHTDFDEVFNLIDGHFDFLRNNVHSKGFVPDYSGMVQ